jgi:hypothetical protein
VKSTRRLSILESGCHDAVVDAEASCDFLLLGFQQLTRPQAVQHRVDAAVLELRIGLFDRQQRNT